MVLKHLYPIPYNYSRHLITKKGELAVTIFQQRENYSEVEFIQRSHVCSVASQKKMFFGMKGRKVSRKF